MEPRLLVLCPSRGRSERIKGMLDSFERTTDPDHTRLQILLDKDDKDLKNYFRKLPSWAQIKVFDRELDRTYTTEILNRAFYQDNEYEFYSVTNDDIEYLTEGWDKKFCNKYKISTGIDDSMMKKYGKDFINNTLIKGFPITSGICGEIARAVGWVQLPTLRHSAGDNVWYWLAKRLGILHIDESIHWVHRSSYFNDGEADETFNRTNAITNRDDFYVFKDWLKYKIHKDINKIRIKCPNIFEIENNEQLAGGVL